MVVCLNLPYEMWHFPENTYFVGITPPPKEPMVTTITALSDPVVDQFQEMWHGKMVPTHNHPNGDFYRAAIIAAIGDLLALKKALGFAGHSSHNFCSFCKLQRNDIDRLDYKSFEPRFGWEILRWAKAWLVAETKVARKAIFKQHGYDNAITAELEELHQDSFIQHDAPASLIRRPSFLFIRESDDNATTEQEDDDGEEEEDDGELDLTMLRQICRRGRLFASISDSAQPADSKSPVAEAMRVLSPRDPLESPQQLSPAQETAYNGSGVLLDLLMYELILGYWNHTHSPPYIHAAELTYDLLDAGVNVLPTRAVQLTEFKHKTRLFSTFKKHHGGSSVSFRHPLTGQKDFGFIQCIWTQALQGQKQTFVVVQPHTDVSPMDAAKTPYPMRPGFACMVRYSEPIRPQPQLIVEPRHIISHVAYYRRPQGTFVTSEPRLIQHEVADTPDAKSNEVAPTRSWWRKAASLGRLRSDPTPSGGGRTVVITTYQTLSMDFQIPKDVDPSEKAQWLSRYGCTRAVAPKPFEDRLLDSDSDDDLPDAPLLGALIKKDKAAQDSISAHKGKGNAGSPRGKGKGKTGNDEVDMPSAAVISNWGRSDRLRGLRPNTLSSLLGAMSHQCSPTQNATSFPRRWWGRIWGLRPNAPSSSLGAMIPSVLPQTKCYESPKTMVGSSLGFEAERAVVVAGSDDPISAPPDKKSCSVTSLPRRWWGRLWGLRLNAPSSSLGVMIPSVLPQTKRYGPLETMVRSSWGFEAERAIVVAGMICKGVLQDPL
ncbi:hypothetical protein C8R44DRAFT_728709 [Mycena epipterygia]|nr:hypothetical protein C8R44DRAFT_728709 [Mycena epipterygia]